jgi:mannosyltransferase OCH1-like enzyme
LYSIYFKNFSIKPTNQYSPDNQYEYIFVTTDTDWNFKFEWINLNVIIINHHYNENRNPYALNYINVAKFKNSTLDYCIPCYPISKATNKIQNNSIAIIGGYEISMYKNKYNSNLINRLRFSNNKPIELHIISCSIDTDALKEINSAISIYLHQNISCLEMDSILKNSSYIILSSCNSSSKREAESASGSIQLAYNYLCQPIISSYTNKFLNLKGSFEFNENDINPIILPDVNFFQLEKYREKYVSYFPIALTNLKKNIKIPKKIMQTWETKTISFEFQQIINSWKIHNSDYEYILFNKDEREDFIKTHFDLTILNTYKKIIPGAYKSDFFRYCYLYINGGIYVDIDTLCLGKLDNFLLPNISFIVPIDLNNNPNDGTHNLACGFIASRPKHPILINCINIIVENVKNKIFSKSKLDFSGPGVLGRAVNKYLNNNELSSFINKEGIINDILFLKFNALTEEVSDLNGNLLFQNKNGNPLISKLYSLECEKINNFVSWISCENIISEEITNIKSIALLIYGQFRTYKYNLRQNIISLWPIFENKNVYVFILSDKNKQGNYSSNNEKEVLDIFNEFNFNVQFLYYIEDIIDTQEKNYCDSFYQTIKHQLGVSNKFVPNLMYRKYLLNKLACDYIKFNKLTIDVFLYARLFDMKISYITNIKGCYVDFDKIKNCIYYLLEDKNNIIGSSDTLFMGSQEGIQNLFNNWNESGEIKIFHDDVWNDIEFTRYAYSCDSFLTTYRHIYSPEIQYLARVYYSKFNYFNIRLDNNNLVNLSSYMVYNIIHDQDRLDFKDKILYLDFSQETLEKAINKFTNNNKMIYSYNNNILIDLLLATSYQLSYSNITIIGAINFLETSYLLYFNDSNKNNVFYSFNDNNNNKSIHIKNNNNYLKVCSENIFNEEERQKYNRFLLTSKIIFININKNNIQDILYLFEWLYKNSFFGLIIYKNNSEDNILPVEITSHKINFNTINHDTIGLLKF